MLPSLRLSQSLTPDHYLRAHLERRPSHPLSRPLVPTLVLARLVPLVHAVVTGKARKAVEKDVAKVAARAAASKVPKEGEDVAGIAAAVLRHTQTEVD